MTAAINPGVAPSTPKPLESRAIRLARVAVLFIAGMVITFSATMHEQVGFDVTVTAVALGLVGLVHVAAWLSQRSRAGAPVALLLGIVAIAAAVVLFLTDTSIGFAVTVAAWALVSSLLEFLGNIVSPGSRSDTVLVGGAGILLALLVLLTREDSVAVLGFFGGYAVLTAVFLGISAFDKRPAGAAELAAPAA